MGNIFSKIRISKLILVYFCNSIIMAILSELPIFKNSSVLDFNFWLLIFNCSLLAWFTFKIIKEKVNLRALWVDFKLSANYKEILFIVIVNITLSLGFLLVTICIIYNINPNLIQKLLNEANSSNTVTSIIFESIGAVIIGPIIEEFMFRGVILNRLKIKKSINFSIITSSILFGLMHFELSILGATFFGIFMCLLFLKYENILIPISAHILNNLIVTVISLTDSSSANTNFTSGEISIYGLSGLLMLLISGYFTFKYIRTNWPKNNTKYLEVN